MFPLGANSMQNSFLGSWLWHVPLHLGSSSVLDYAALAVAWAYFGRVSSNQNAINRARISYSVALRALAAALDDTTMQYSAEVICATMLLGLYEVCQMLSINPSIKKRLKIDLIIFQSFNKVSHAWIRHAGGAARLMQLRGARRCYGSAFEYSMFLAWRGTIVCILIDWLTNLII